MKTFRRLTALVLLFLVVFPLFVVWKYPDAGYRFVLKAIERYRGGIQGTMKVAEAGDWKEAAPGLSWRHLRVERKKEWFSLRLLALRIDPARYELKVVSVPLDRIAQTPVTAVAKSLGAHAVINGSFFNAELGILGLAIADGKQVSAQTFAGENRGIFFVRKGRPQLIHRNRFAPEGVTQAIQSGPWLISSSVPQTEYKRPDHINRRSAVCLDDEGRVLQVVTDTAVNGITLSDFARALEGLGCREALNLDGGTSTQMLLWTQARKMLVRGYVNVPVYLAAIPRKDVQ